MLTSLYFSQGIPTGFITITLAALWAGMGYSASAIASLLVISYLPWAFKILFAPFVDKYTNSTMGRRRPWILISQFAMIGTLIGMTSITGIIEKPIILGLFLFLYNSFCSLQDVSTDALAIDQLKVYERGLANGFMWSGKIVGIAFGGFGLGTLLESMSFEGILWIQIITLSAVFLIPLFILEEEGNKRFSWSGFMLKRDRKKIGNFEFTVLINEIRSAFEPIPIRLIGVLALVAALPTRMLVVIGPVFTIEAAGWTSLGYSQFAGGPALLFGVIGALVGGFFADRFGRRKTLLYAQIGICVLLFSFTFASSWWGNAAVVAIFIGAGVFFDVVLKTTLAALFMDVTRKDVAATQFTIFMTMGNLCNVLGALIIIPLDFVFGFAGLFLSAAMLSIAILVFLSYKKLRLAFIPAGVRL